MRRILLAFSILAFLTATACKERSGEESGSSTKAIGGVEDGGVNTAGEITFILKCKAGWVNTAANGVQSDRVTVTETEFNAGNVTKKYCITELPKSGNNGTGNTDNSGTGNNGTGNTGNTGGTGNNPPIGNAQGLVTIAKGFYLRTEGTLPCKMVNFSPVLQLGVLKRVDITCQNQPALSGPYACSDNANCKKGTDTLTYFDDRFEIESNGVIGGYSTNAVALPQFVVVTTVDDNGTGQQSATFTIAGKSPVEYTDPQLTNFCNTLATVPTGQIWGYRYNGVSNACNDFPATQAGLQSFCLQVIKPRVVQDFNTWLNAN